MALNLESFNVAKGKIAESVSLPDYYMDYVDETINLDRYNRDCCPLHDEDSPSFFYFEDSGRFHCFGCDKSGTVVDLHYYLRKREEPSFNYIRAVLELSELYKVNIPDIFKNVDLKEKIKLGNDSKLKFKKPEELVKPVKKDIVDLENFIIKNKNNLGLEQFKEVINDLDSILFLECDLVKEIADLKSKVKTYLNK